MDVCGLGELLDLLDPLEKLCVVGVGRAHACCVSVWSVKMCGVTAGWVCEEEQRQHRFTAGLFARSLSWTALFRHFLRNFPPLTESTNQKVRIKR